MSTEEITVKSVDEWLNGVQYGDDPNYLPSRFALGFVAFIKLVNGGEGEENKTPVLHLKMLDNIGDIPPNKRFIRIANMVHRGAAKTTLFGEYLFLYLAVYQSIPGFGTVNLAIYVSDSIDNGVKNMRKNLEYRWSNSDFLKALLPETRFTDIRWEFKNSLGSIFIVKAYGAKTGVRGTKEMGKRPNVAVLDDLVSDEDARSKTVIETIKTTVNNAIEYAMHPAKNLIVWSGTPFNQNDPLYTAVESGAWDVNVYPVCEKFPCTREEFRGSWPDRFDFDYVLSTYTKASQQGKASAFYQEMMLRIMNDDDRLILESDLPTYSSRILLKNKSYFNFYITTDFATSEKQSADFSSISVWAVNNKGYYYWVDGILTRQTMDKNIDDLFRLVQIYNPMSVGVEVSGQQKGFISWINQEMMNRNIYFMFASSSNNNEAGIRPTTDKLQRFNVVLPMFKQGRMFFPQERMAEPILKEGLEQLKLISPHGFKSKHDDFIDTVSMLGSMKVIYPNGEDPLKTNAANIWGNQSLTGDDSSSNFVSYIV